MHIGRPSSFSILASCRVKKSQLYTGRGLDENEVDILVVPIYRKTPETPTKKGTSWG